MAKNLYVIEESHVDCSPRMFVIIASDLEECRSLFSDKFADGWRNMEKYDKTIFNHHYKVISVSDNEESRIVSYV
jgi:hypothetical protein